jgi:phenylpropionate dioxygenase-like ring-hydroxylating dioxygenase large terminal subunit
LQAIGKLSTEPSLKENTMKMDTWYCAGRSRELGTGPIGRKLLGHPVVLFRDASGTARALGARCPHRGADLTSGVVVDGGLQCPFHGWRFDGLGQCVRVPSQPESAKISALARVPSFPLHEREGILWIWMGAGETQSCEPPEYPVSHPGRFVRRLSFDAQLIAAPFLTVLENAFDKAHVPFIHRGTFGPDQNPLVARQRITVDLDGRGLRAEDDPNSPWQADPRIPGGRLGRLLGLRRPIAQHTRFDVEGVVQIYLEYPNGTYDLFVTHITPADERHTWLFVESVRTRAPHALGDWFQRRAIGKVFEEGKRETSLILAAGPDGLPRPISVESDRLGLAARQLYERWAGGSAVSARDRDLAVNL